MEVKCKDCKFFEMFTLGEDRTDAEGWCHRFPPDKDSEFSTTWMEEWCGEYKHVENESNDSEAGYDEVVLRVLTSCIEENKDLVKRVISRDFGEIDTVKIRDLAEVIDMPARTVSHIVRHVLILNTYRSSDGYRIILDKDKITTALKRFGLE